MDELMDELEKAHLDYEERKARVISNLECMSSNLRADPNIPDLYSEWLDTAVEFIKEKEI